MTFGNKRLYLVLQAPFLNFSIDLQVMITQFKDKKVIHWNTSIMTAVTAWKML